MESAREANFLEMEIKEKELQESFKRQVEKCVSNIMSSRESFVCVDRGEDSLDDTV
jgi:hypothetical protein